MEQENRKNISKIKRRILQYIDFLGITREEFYKKVSLNGANFRGKSASSELSVDKIVKILRSYTNLNPDWLLLGDGEILRSNAEISTPSDNSNELQMISELAQQVGQLKAENEMLKKENAHLENVVKGAIATDVSA